MKPLILALLLCGCSHAPRRITIGSKKFTESVLLAEIAAQLARAAGPPVALAHQLGGTQVLWNALTAGRIDAYPEYTGTLDQDVFHGHTHTDEERRRALAEHGVRMTASLGFQDTYAIGLNEAVAARLNIKTLSDLAQHPELQLGFSEEFLNRADGWPKVREQYRLPQHDVRSLDHDLAYRGLQAGTLDGTDLYSTDAEIGYYKLRVLEDDRHQFPEYRAVILYRADLASRAPEVVAALERLAGRIDEPAMRALNARAKLDKIPEAEVASEFCQARLGVATRVERRSRAAELWQRTLEHLTLVALSLAAAILFALPLGIWAARRPRLGQVVLALAGVLQTIPSLALLVFMIPLLGIGAPPAIVALFLYSLLPILRNTYTGLRDLPPPLRESAEALGLGPGARLRLVELPLASRAILAGIKTSAVICVGTATLGAIIGAGGYGQPILTGIRLDDLSLILEGAIPAAALALVVQGLFEALERLIVPRGLRL